MPEPQRVARVQLDFTAPSTVRLAESIARYEPDQITVALVESHWDQMLSGAKPVEFEFKTITSRELAHADFRHDYLVEDILVRGQPMILAGPRKSLKTNTSIDLALSLAQAGLFLGRFDVELVRDHAVFPQA